MPVSVRVGGAWRAATNVFTRVGGTWRTASDMPVRVGGVWKTGTLSNTAYESIASSTPTSGTSVTFSSIPSTYKHLQVRIHTMTALGDGINIVLNGDVTRNYYEVYFNNLNGTTTINGDWQFSTRLLNRSGDAGATVQPFVAVVDLIDYASTSKSKQLRAITGTNNNGTGRDTVGISSHLWNSTAAVTSLAVNLNPGTSWGAGTTISLYGIKG